MYIVKNIRVINVKKQIFLKIRKFLHFKINFSIESGPHS